MLQASKFLKNNLKPTSIILDFEIGVINAFKKKFLWLKYGTVILILNNPYGDVFKNVNFQKKPEKFL